MYFLIIYIILKNSTIGKAWVQFLEEEKLSLTLKPPPLSGMEVDVSHFQGGMELINMGEIELVRDDREKKEI